MKLKNKKRSILRRKQLLKKRNFLIVKKGLFTEMNKYYECAKSELDLFHPHPLDMSNEKGW